MALLWRAEERSDIISSCVIIFPMQKILVQGELGSFHHEAAMKLFGSDVEIIPCPSFANVFSRLEKNKTGLALVAIENSLYGTINEVADGLEATPEIKIFAEIELSIHQNLITLPGVAASGIRKVYSHFAALAQCEKYLEDNFPQVEKIEYEDTAAAVRYIVEQNDPTLAAIAGRSAADLYDVQILAPQIEDNAVNFTKFAALSRSPDRDRELVRQPLAGKSSIILTTGHQPGALYEALGVFVSHKINLTKLQSRPIPGEKWHYRFYLDFEADADETMQIIKGLESLDNNVVFLGNY